MQDVRFSSLVSLAAVGLAKVIDSDVKTAMMLLARATKGEFTLFSRYGIKLDETASAQEKFNQVFKASMEGLKIQAAQVVTRGVVAIVGELNGQTPLGAAPLAVLTSTPYAPGNEGEAFEAAHEGFVEEDKRL